jgi:hypothetical protein
MRNSNSSSGPLIWARRRWKRLPTDFRWHIEDSFQPEDISERLLPDEVPVLSIGLAWYRGFPATYVFQFLGLLIILTVMATAVLVILGLLNRLSLLFAFAPPLTLIAIILGSVRQYITYKQWRVLRTNKRLIISLPQINGFPLIDNIELKGLPVVVDTNWSRNPVWRFFQFFTGARDMYISMVAYRFNENTARVGDALIIPDVTLHDVLEFKKVVFS